ncbi:MAG: hypothetical protein VXX46_01545 [Bacteroidota bacterium]|nr:hypothetical protein [Bacteroidota bacterium]
MNPKELLDTTEYTQYGSFFFGEDSTFISFDGYWMGFARRTPMYPLILWLTNKYVLIFLQWCTSITLPALIYHFLALDNESRQGKHWFWIICGIFPLQYFYTGFYMPEIWAELGVAFWLLALKNRRFGIAGMASAFLILLKPIFIFVTLLNFAVSMVHYLKERQFVQPSISWILPILAVTLLLFWNHSNGYSGISSVGTTNAYDYNRYMLINEEKGGAYADSLYSVEARSLASMSNRDMAKGEWMMNAFYRSVFDYPLTYAWVHIKGMLRMFIDPGRYDAMVFFNWIETNGLLHVKSTNKQGSIPLFQWFYIGFFALLSFLRLGLFWLGVRVLDFKKDWVWASCFFILGYTALIGPVGTARYLVPLFPIIWVFAWYGCKRILNENSTSE